MPSKSKMIVTRTAGELAEALGLDPSDAVEWEVRYSLTRKIIEMVKKKSSPSAQWPKTPKLREPGAPRSSKGIRTAF